MKRIINLLCIGSTIFVLLTLYDYLRTVAGITYGIPLEYIEKPSLILIPLLFGVITMVIFYSIKIIINKKIGDE